ncbi:CpaF family protein [Candidatus Woesearchaeota archaeon]|nr:CpaF family protein [Candidatus Woesearchaeota archaeon]
MGGIAKKTKVVKKRIKAGKTKLKKKPSESDKSEEQSSKSGSAPKGGDQKEMHKDLPQFPKKQDKKKIQLETYEYTSKKIPVTITISRVEGEFVPLYEVSISKIGRTTELILEKIRQELIKQVNLGIVEITDTKKTNIVEDKFKETIQILIDKYFPDIDDQTREFLVSYLIQKSLGMGNIEILMDDKAIEEVVINSSNDPVWCFHKKHGWLKTNVNIFDEEQTRHYATMIGRRVGRQITVLEPLLDANLKEGDRVNATIMPISTAGNTITLRKFSRDPMTITHFLRFKTFSYEAASLIWLAMHFELSALIAGGTASGKTSTLNVLGTFFPPNQRIISIEDTREIRLPKFLHWVPLSTRLPNAEGKGAVSMEDLLVNSLRMRPDRILVGEVRRQREAETLFEAIHTGHSCYATFHANNAEETVRRLTNPPINVPVTMLPAISMIIMQFRNRRTGLRRTFQIAEITHEGDENTLMQYDVKKDVLVNKNKSKSLMETLQLYTGHTPAEIKYDMKEKQTVLQYLVKQNIDTVDGVGRIMAEYYTNKQNLLKFVKSNKTFG